MSLAAESGAGSPPVLHKREAGRFAEYRRELATRFIVGNTVMVACLLCGFPCYSFLDFSDGISTFCSVDVKL
jgi:hypothetical protein